MLKKCLKSVLCICILLAFGLLAVNAAACFDEQNALVAYDGLSEQKDESTQSNFELDDLTASIPCFHAAHKTSTERSSLSRKNPIYDLYSVEPQSDVRCERIFNRICEKLNEIEFQRILKKNE
ncbi:MAG: hypothetical protein UH824_00180 [Acutalibacteraceae bacterium]|nr:hypothetical protein [Acutalibacteraceae bacterium]